MKYNTFIKEGTAVSEIGLGAWQLGQNSGWKNMTEKEAEALVHQSLDLGINFFDTAPNYGHGTGEERLGKALQNTDRSKIVINTKFGHTHMGHLNFNADYIRESLEGSLKRLQVDYVDSLLIHNPPSDYFDGNTNDHYGILESLVEEGKIKAYGASLDTYKDMKLLMETTSSKVIEVFFNIFHQDVAQGFDQATENEVSLIAKIPLDSGWLSGKYNANSRFDDIRARWNPSDIQTRADLVEKVRSIMDTEEELSQQAIAFCVSYDAISTVIPGNVNATQLMSNVRSAKVSMPPNRVKELETFYQKEIKGLNLPW